VRILPGEWRKAERKEKKRERREKREEERKKKREKKRRRKFYSPRDSTEICARAVRPYDAVYYAFAQGCMYVRTYVEHNFINPALDRSYCAINFNSRHDRRACMPWRFLAPPVVDFVDCMINMEYPEELM